LYIAALAGLSVFVVLNHKYRSESFRNLDKREHPLKAIYPACAKIRDLIGKRIRSGSTEYSRTMLRSLYVKENVEREILIYQVRKWSYIITVLAAGLLTAVICTILDPGSSRIVSLERAPYGKGNTNYELDVSYRNNEDQISIDVNEMKLDEAGIAELFESSYEGVRQKMLGDNRSCDEVNRPVNLISEYNGFNIYWKIEDSELLGYSGDIKAEIPEGEKAVVNLLAFFSLDGITREYNYPICLVSPDLEEREELISRIMREIEQNNDRHESRVKLPDSINGYEIVFRTITGNYAFAVIAMAVMAIIAIIILYDRNLENRVNRRNEALMMDFARIVPKLSLLYDAGLSIHGAFARIVSDHEKVMALKPYKKRTKREGSDYAYKEMKLALEKIRSGMGEGEAYSQFGKRCALQQYIKLGNILEQNLSKGTRGMQELLDEEVKIAYEERKRMARKKGEQASTKMLLPMILMLMVVILIIAYPALVSMKL